MWCTCKNIAMSRPIHGFGYQDPGLEGSWIPGSASSAALDENLPSQVTWMAERGPIAHPGPEGPISGLVARGAVTPSVEQAQVGLSPVSAVDTGIQERAVWALSAFYEHRALQLVCVNTGNPQSDTGIHPGLGESSLPCLHDCYTECCSRLPCHGCAGGTHAGSCS